MGSGVGVFSDNDVQGLTQEARLKLKLAILEQLQSRQVTDLASAQDQVDITAILSRDPTFLEMFMAKNPAIRDEVKRHVDPLLRQLRGG